MDLRKEIKMIWFAIFALAIAGILSGPSCETGKRVVSSSEETMTLKGMDCKQINDDLIVCTRKK